MKLRHWLLALVAVGIWVTESILPGQSSQPGRYILYHYILEIAYFFVLLALGSAIGGLVQKRLLARQDREEYVRSLRVYRLLAALFVAAAGMYLITLWLPGWIGRNIIFFGGYYYGLSRLKGEAEAK